LTWKGSRGGRRLGEGEGVRGGGLRISEEGNSVIVTRGKDKQETKWSSKWLSKTTCLQWRQRVNTNLSNNGNFPNICEYFKGIRGELSLDDSWRDEGIEWPSMTGVSSRMPNAWAMTLSSRRLWIKQGKRSII